ncbi:branched-chain-amino-acid transaminase [Streptomyces sp. NPDC018964]|uniref:branched-chain-amino-acid transaminase n=1 Tax=unclassified Streptomyces TaxID=2593676 RepID=UPI0037A98CDA
MTGLVHIDGAFVPHDAARVGVYDHGLLYGDGIYEGLRVYDAVVFQAEQHIDRLYRSAKCLRLVLPPREEIRHAVCETVRRNGLRDAYVRLVVTRGTGQIGPDPRSCPRPTLIVIAEPTPPLHGSAGQSGLSATVATTRRNAVDATTAQIKSLNYLGSVLARIEAQEAGVDEAIMLDARGFVSESPVCNVFLVRDGILLTPGESSGILRGITRDFVIGLAREAGVPVVERDVSPYELLTADEVFLTGTHAEMAPVTRVGGVPVGTGEVGEVCRALTKSFQAAVRDPAHGTPL